ncbi:MAG: hypothetical protein A3J63_00940 [Candidatus Moranbacteria bacterium RIFCSPHIGHO2_02_FULL_40_12b]|nr:MAG: hypothetical protein A3J63_00940 [Candidatus Moranbacteria bacterium RIFCSPHIGHO2_02_FULL_40_12b]OGI23793.1 MAG: hypothetical protein A3E91_00950 [Candidatus Moranbacteria bacterium RIFCSPHIGHO2_12_FULL_40_10]
MSAKLLSLASRLWERDYLSGDYAESHPCRVYNRVINFSRMESSLLFPGAGCFVLLIFEFFG